MPILVENKTGQSVNVSDAEAPSLLASGNFSFQTPTVNLVKPNGDIYQFDSKDSVIHEALNNGWTIESPESAHKRFIHENYDNPLLAGALGAARTLSFGTSDVLARAAGIKAETLKGLAEENPIATGVGEYGIIPLSLLVPGGEGGALTKGLRGLTSGIRGVSELGEAAGTAARKGLGTYLGITAEPGSTAFARALSKGTELATQGVVEGAFYGTGQLVSEHALGDTELNAEHIVSEIGGSALIGGLIGGLGGSLIGAASPIAEKFKARMAERLDELPINREAISDKMRDAAQYYSLKSTGAIGKTLRMLDDRELLDISPNALLQTVHPDGEFVFKAGLKPGEISERLNDFVDTTARELGSINKTADHFSANGIGYDNLQMADMLENKFIKPQAEHAGQLVVRARIQPIIDNWRKLSPEVATGTTAAAPAKAVDLAAGTMPEITKIPVPITFEALQRERNTFADMYLKNDDSKGINRSLREVERFYREIQLDSLKKVVPPETYERYLDLSKNFRDLKLLADQTNVRTKNLTGFRAFSLGDRMLANQITATAGLTGAIMHGSIAAGLGAGALVYPAAMLAARAVRTRLPSVLAVMFDKGSRLMAVEKIAKASSSAADAEAARLAEYLEKQHVKEKIFKRKLRDDTIRGVKNESVKISIEDGSPKPTADASQFAERQAEVYLSYLKPKEREKLRASVSSELEDVAPQIASHLINKLMSIAAFMAAKAPRRSGIDLLQPKADRDQKMSSNEAITYLRYLRAVDRPLSVLDDIQHGVINSEGVEVLRALYPRMHQQIMLSTIKRLADSENPMPYSARVVLGALFDIPSDPSMDPQFMQLLQSSMKKQQIAESNGRGKSPQLDAQSLQTMTQKISSGAEIK